ncbi:hypothetical protein AB0P37_50620 [Streptomyces antimycoticus]|uniref:hypothetical protein n=1 Tax=Streptomyces antimycoticus TaxID=68175 RepID=UPI00343483AD
MLVEDASLAGAGAELPSGGADRAAAPEVRVGVGALREQLQQFGQRLHFVATRAGRPDDLGRPGIDELVDEPQGGRGRGLVTGTGQQLGAGDDGPGQAALSGGPDGGTSECGQDRVRIEGGVEARDEPGEFPQRITVGVRAVCAAGLAVAVPAGDASLFVAARADGRLVEAG